MGDHDAQVHPVMSPVADLLGLRGTQRIVMHPRSKNAQTSLATKRVVARQRDRRVFADQAVDDQRRQQSPEVIDVPDGVTEEAVVVGEVPVADGITGDDQVGHVSMSNGENPPCHQQTKGLKAGFGENGRECV